MKRSGTISLVTIGVLFANCCYGQVDQLSVYGYLNLISRDFFEREFPNGATENPPATFSLLRTHILLNSKISTNWTSFLNIRFQNGADLA